MIENVECGCPVSDGKIYHLLATCTDALVAKLDWYATIPQPAYEIIALWFGETGGNVTVND